MGKQYAQNWIRTATRQLLLRGPGAPRGITAETHTAVRLGVFQFVTAVVQETQAWVHRKYVTPVNLLIVRHQR